MNVISGKLHNPGSDDALEVGCQCPVEENSHGAGYKGLQGFFIISEACEYHRPEPEEEE